VASSALVISWACALEAREITWLAFPRTFKLATSTSRLASLNNKIADEKKNN